MPQRQRSALPLIAAGIGLLLLCAAPCRSGEADAAPAVDITFLYQRLDGTSSNQFAVWVENAAGDVVRTLFATDFIAGRGGWKYREHALPLWREKAKIADLTKEEIDAFTGATPGSGVFGYSWDCTDAAGEAVAPGAYAVVVEGTLRNDDRVVFRAPLTLGGESETVRPGPEFFGDGVNDRDMIREVEVKYLR